MYKRTAHSAHYLPRTGSHSTKGARNGRVDVLPPTAKAQVFTDIVERKRALVERLNAAQRTLAIVSAEKDSPAILKANAEYSKATVTQRFRGGAPPMMPFVLAEWMTRHKEAKAAVKEIQTDLHDLEKANDLKHLRRQSFCETFVAVAQCLLDKETFERLREETRSRTKKAGQ